MIWTIIDVSRGPTWNLQVWYFANTIVFKAKYQTWRFHVGLKNMTFVHVICQINPMTRNRKGQRDWLPLLHWKKNKSNKLYVINLLGINFVWFYSCLLILLLMMNTVYVFKISSQIFYLFTVDKKVSSLFWTVLLSSWKGSVVFEVISTLWNFLLFLDFEK